MECHCDGVGFESVRKQCESQGVKVKVDIVDGKGVIARGGGGGDAVWGSIAGNINNQTDLNKEFVRKTNLTKKPRKNL